MKRDFIAHRSLKKKQKKTGFHCEEKNDDLIFLNQPQVASKFQFWLLNHCTEPMQLHGTT